MSSNAKFIGVISDTHGLIRDAALSVLEGSELILHAGDIGAPDVLTRLRAIAPVVAVRGNVDHGAWARTLPATESVTINGISIYLLHNAADIGLDPRGRFDAVVFGHSHKPCNELKGGVLYFNPAGAGPRRFRLPIAVGKLWCRDGHIQGEIITLRV
jgi:uncharacterized protein